MSSGPGGRAYAAPAGELDQGWQRLHPLSPLVRSGRGLIVLAVAGLGGASGGGDSIPLLVDLGAVALLLIASVTAWAVTRWRIEGGVLLIESGLIRRNSRRYPPDRIQAVDTVRPVLARVFGLAEVRVRMAASTSSAGRLSYLSDVGADAVRARLLALAHGVAESTPAPPERVLFSTPAGPLIASILLSGLGVVLEAVVVGLIILAVLEPSAVAPAVSGSGTALIALGTTFFRRFNSQYDFTLAEAPDGLRLRAGLLQTASETIPRGRVQAIRMVEPLLWRPFGWHRLVVDVAGKQRTGHEDRSVGATLRVLLPVGSQQHAAWLVQWLFPGAPVPTATRLETATGRSGRPPARAQVKSPLRYRYLSWTVDDAYAATTSGRVRRVTDWVPLAKVQSIRWVEGPLQRKLRLASVHLDTAGRNIHAIGRDRDHLEATRLIASLPEACRAARVRSSPRPA